MTTKAILIDNTKQLDPNLLLVSSSALSDVLDATLVPFPSGLQTGPAKPRGGNLVRRF